mmetsp:Transcript_17000/g.26203  ORF Transcript_17000/g.26203 Transcript_17000/m.26203 type:complete len:92 (-) Transcript_17000:748-1023(-)
MQEDFVSNGFELQHTPWNSGIREGIQYTENFFPNPEQSTSPVMSHNFPASIAPGTGFNSNEDLKVLNDIYDLMRTASESKNLITPISKPPG